MTEPSAPSATEIREARIAQLKADYQAGALSVDPIALAGKLVDAHLADQEPTGPAFVSVTQA